MMTGTRTVMTTSRLGDFEVVDEGTSAWRKALRCGEVGHNAITAITPTADHLEGWKDPALDWPSHRHDAGV